MTGNQELIPARLAEILERSAVQFPDHGVGYVQPDLKVIFQTFPQLLDHSRRLLKGLQSLGVRKGDIAILSLDSNAEIIPVLWACFTGGIVPALLQPPVSFSEYNPAAEKAGKVFRLLGNPWVILSHNHLNSWLAGGIPSPNLIDVAEIPANDPDPVIPVISSRDLALLQFSSGSTGDPKGVSLSHHNILHNIFDIINGLELKSGETSVSWMPLYHDMGLIGFHLTPVCTGTTAYYIEPADFIKNPLLWLETMSHKRSVITGCPNFGQIIVNRAIARKKDPAWDLSGIRVIFNGAEPISVPTMNEFNSRLKPFGYDTAAMLPCYGMAEATLAVSFTPLSAEPVVCNFKRSELFGNGIAIETSDEEDSVQLVNLGKSLSFCEILIAGENGKPLPPGLTGHVFVRGENITSGYFNDPDATAAAIKEGWLHTGDLGFMHGGDLFIMGRLKDIIFINGINYYAHDLETVALRAEGISWGRIVLAGYFDEREGKDKVLVFIVAPENEKSMDLFRSLQRHFLETIGLMIDTFIPIRSNDIPRTSSGKVRRYKMVNRFLKGECSSVVRLT